MTATRIPGPPHARRPRPVGVQEISGSGASGAELLTAGEYTRAADSHHPRHPGAGHTLTRDCARGDQSRYDSPKPSARATSWTVTTQDSSLPAALIRLNADAERLHSHAPQGDMVWRAWGSGPALVLLHGGSGSWSHWVHTIGHFRHRYRIIAGDLPGLGDSPSPAEPYDEHSLAQAISSGIDQILEPREPLQLVGFSFGGILGGHVAHLQAHRMRSLCVVGSPPFGIGGSGPANAITAVDPELEFSQAVPLHRRNLALMMLADPAAVDTLALRIHHENLRRARLRSRKIARTDTLARALVRLRCRVDGIWGNEDVTIHPDLESIRALFAGLHAAGHFQVLPGVGHWAAYEAPREFNAALERALG